MVLMSIYNSCFDRKKKQVSKNVTTHLHCLNEVDQINILNSCFEHKIQI